MFKFQFYVKNSWNILTQYVQEYLFLAPGHLNEFINPIKKNASYNTRYICSTVESLVNTFLKGKR